MTEKIYQTQPYLKELDTVVTSIEGCKIITEKTIFAPDAGGQPCDLGTINGVEIKYVHEENGILYHEISKDDATKFAAGMSVSMSIDWERRFDHMQNHLGEHILSGLFKSVYDADNKGFHLGDDIAHFDIALKTISPDMLENIERLANQAVYDAKKVTVIQTASADEARTYPLRKEIDIEGDILVVMVEDIDCCACCCPHPSDTSQVGIIKMISTEKYKGMTRIYFKCGKRALYDYEKKHDVISVLNKKYSADEFTLLEKVKIADGKNEELRKELNKMKDKFADMMCDSVLAEAENQGSTAVVHEFEYETLDDLRRIAKKIIAKTDLPVLISSLHEKCVFLTHSGKSSLKCGAVVKEFAVGAGGKGGGSDTQAQVIFNSEDTMRNFILIAKASCK